MSLTRQGWPRVQLGSVAKVDRTILPPEGIRDGTLYVGLEHIDAGGSLAAILVQSGALRSPKFAFGSRHVLFGKLRPYLRKVARPTAQGVCSTDILPILPGDDLDRDYLFHWLRSPATTAIATSRAEGVNLPRVSPKALLGLELPLPPHAEQRRIAAILDKADAVRRKRRESLRLLDGLLPAVFLDMFGDAVMQPNARPLEASWCVVTVEEIAAGNRDACVGGPFGSSLTRADYISKPGVPVIRGNNLIADRGAFHDDDFVFVSEAKAGTLSRNVALPGDIVLTQRGTLGQVAQIPWSARYTKYVISQSQMKLAINEEIADPRYVVHYFLSPRALLALKSRTLATGVPHINLSILKTFPVVLPPLPLQKQFGTLVSRHQATRASIEAAGWETEQLFDSLARRGFRGEL